MPAIPIEEKELDGKIGTLGEKISSLEGSVTGIKSKTLNFTLSFHSGRNSGSNVC